MSNTSIGADKGPVRNVSPGYAWGWFAVGWSEDFAAGQSKPLRYFGEDLVGYRGQDGVVRVMEAYCAHMGAHLGQPGKVDGDCLVCPFHGWKFGPDGKCVEIPYAKKVPVKAAQRMWPTVERNGVVFMWNGPEGEAPRFEVPIIPEYGTDEWLPWAQNLYHIKTHPREIVENLADRAHFQFVHRTEITDFRFELDGHTATQIATGQAALPGGAYDRFSSRTTYHGPGILLMRFDGMLQNYMLVMHTPVEDYSLDLRMGVTLKVHGDRKRTEGYVGGYMANLKAGFKDDLRIWEHKLWRDRPVLCDGDGPIMQLRKWYKQFYLPPGGVPTAEASPEV